MSERRRLRLGGALFDHDRLGGVRIAGSTVWLLFILFPVADAIGSRGSTVPHGLIIAGAAAFIAGYLALVVRFRRRARGRAPVVLFGMLLALATFLTVTNKSGLGFLFTYCAACAAMISPHRFVVPAVGACVVLAGTMSAIGGASGGVVVGAVASTAGIGLLMVLMRDLRDRNVELSEARAELARLAVAQERERFARDLHDLLGHSLSVIALKAELAGRLLPAGASDAAAEIEEVERVARDALGEVRDAVSGYRRPTLDGELAGARMALSAAGIEASVQRSPASLGPRAEAVFAWAVREGATNVIRHSRARRCLVKIGADLGAATLEMIDDGAGSAAAPAITNGGGHGLAGLAERVSELRGRVEAGERPEGGFRLAVTVPTGTP